MKAIGKQKTILSFRDDTCSSVAETLPACPRAERPGHLIASSSHLQPSAFSLQPSMSVKPPRRGGFTLIEMLVVVIIIAILAGMVLGLFKMAGTWTAKAQTNERLGKVRAAIEEFYAEYGKYPPVPTYGGTQPFGYEYPRSNTVNSAISSGPWADPSTPWSTCPTFTFGLMSFLVQRYGDEWGRGGNYHAVTVLGHLSYQEVFSMRQWEDFNASQRDRQRDVDAIRRWKVHIQDVQELDLFPHFWNVPTLGYTNFLLTVRDAWGTELKYESPPPYQAYKLSSAGPDKAFGTADDLSTGAGF